MTETPFAPVRQRLDQGPVDARHAAVVVSGDFLAFACRQKDLDGLAGRRKVVRAPFVQSPGLIWDRFGEH